MPATLLAALFGALREESEGTDLILAEGIPESGEGLAYMNRLLRASGFKVIKY